MHAFQFSASIISNRRENSPTTFSCLEVVQNNNLVFNIFVIYYFVGVENELIFFRKGAETDGRHNRDGLYYLQKTQLHYDDNQKKAKQETGDKEILQMVQDFCLAQGIEVV